MREVTHDGQLLFRPMSKKLPNSFEKLLRVSILEKSAVPLVIG